MSNIMEVTDNTYESEVIKSSTLTVVDFWAPWCGPCKMIAPALEELANKFGNKIKIAKVNVDENQQIAAQMGITSIPTLIFYKNGNIVDKVIGALRKAQLEEKITSQLD